MTIVDFVSGHDLRTARESIQTLSHRILYEESQLKRQELFSIANMNEDLDTIETHRKLGLATMSQIFKDHRGNFVKLYENPSYAICEVVASVVLLASDLNPEYKMAYRLGRVAVNGEYKFCSISDYFPKKLKSFTHWLLECYKYKAVSYNSLDYDSIELGPQQVKPAVFVEDVMFLFQQKDNMNQLLESIYLFFEQKNIELLDYDKEVISNYIEEYRVCRTFDAYVLNTDRSKNNLGLFGGTPAPLFDLGMAFNKFNAYKEQNKLREVPADRYASIVCNHKLSETQMKVEESLRFSKQITDELISKLREVGLRDLGEFIKYSLSR